MRRYIRLSHRLRTLPRIYGPPAMPRAIVVLDEPSIVPVEATRSLRNFNLVSPTSHRGSIVDDRTRREHVYESRLEEHHLICAIASDDVQSIEEQVPTTYVDDDGVYRDHTLDLALGLRDGRRVIIGVKPTGLVEKAGLADVLARIGARHGRSLADATAVRTEADVHPDDVADARLKIHARRLADDDADRALQSMLPSLVGWCRLSDLAEAIDPDDGKGFCAVVRAIASQKLTVRDQQRITPACFVGPTPRH